MAQIGRNIEEAARFLKAGELVAIPTETVYGLAANALDEKAAVKIFEAKERPFFDPLIVHIPSIKYVPLYAATFPAKARLLAERFWPGPLTLVLPKKDIIPDIVTSGQDTVGLRVPNHPLTLRLLTALPFPLAAPSANPFGYISPTRAEHVQAQLGARIPYILDGGPCEVGLESTIIGFPDDKATLYRLGGIPIEDIEACIGKIDLQLNQSSNPSAPGQLSSHYAPRKPFLLGNIAALSAGKDLQKIGVISFQATPEGSFLRTWQLSPDGHLPEAAGNLFHILREADQSNAELIIAEPVPNTGIGRAINDRLQRAAAR